jgi:hypothetical protein
MVRVLALVLLALAPFARAFPAERPISVSRVGIAADTLPVSIEGAPGDGRFLVTWASRDRGGQAAVLDLSGQPLADTSIGLPLRAYAVFWRDDAWTIVGHTGLAWGWVRMNRDGVLLDGAVRPLAVTIAVEQMVWTGSSLVAVGQTDEVIRVVTYDADLSLHASHDLSRQSYAGFLRLATDGQTALVAYYENGFGPKPLKTALFSADGALLKTKDISSPGGVVRAMGSAGNGSGYVLLTQTSVQNHAQFGAFRLDRELTRRSAPGGFGRPLWLFETSESLVWDGSAFAFFYLCDTEVRMARLSATGTILDDGLVRTIEDATLRVDTGLAVVAGMETTLLLFMRGEGQDFNEEPQFLRVIAGHDAADLRASEEVELELGAFQQIRPAAASNATQSLVAWRERATVLAPHLVYATRVDAEGNVRDPQSLLIGAASCDQTTPAVATNGDSFLVTWYDDAGVMAARIGADGSVSATTRVDHFREQPCSEVFSTVLSNGTDYLVVWRRMGGETRDVVLAARVAANGALIDTVPIDLGSAAGTVYGASNGTDYLLAWDGRMVRVAANGTRLDAKIGLGSGTRVDGDGTTAVWWNGTSWSLAQFEQQGFLYTYQLARVTPDGTVTKVGSPVSWPTSARTWGDGRFTCHTAGCTLTLGTIEDGAYFLRPVVAADDGGQPFLRLGDAAPVAPVLLRDEHELMNLVTFGVPGGRRFVAFTRYALEHPYSGISRIFIRPAAVTRGRVVRH